MGELLVDYGNDHVYKPGSGYFGPILVVLCFVVFKILKEVIHLMIYGTDLVHGKTKLLSPFQNTWVKSSKISLKQLS